MGLRDRAITTTCYEWIHLLSIGDGRQIVCDSLQFCQQKYQAPILGDVIMPNHLHLVLQFKDGAKRIGFMRDFKKFTSTKIRREIEKYRPQLLENIIYMKDGQIFKVWQDRYDEVFISNKEVMEIKLHYIHHNPLQGHWNLVSSPEQYPYSSASYYESGLQNDLEVTHYMDYF